MATTATGKLPLPGASPLPAVFSGGRPPSPRTPNAARDTMSPLGQIDPSASYFSSSVSAAAAAAVVPRSAFTDERGSSSPLGTGSGVHTEAAMAPSQLGRRSPERRREPETLLPLNVSPISRPVADTALRVPAPAAPATSESASLGVSSHKLPIYSKPSEEKTVDTMAAFVARKAQRILQRFIVRTPHALLAAGAVYLPYEYYFNPGKGAMEAGLFVLTASAIYCFVRALYLEVIPAWMLPHEPKYNTWRQAINVSNTIFFTLAVTSAVWKLHISSEHGLLLWALFFVAPYTKLSGYYPDIDKDPVWKQQET
jgi:uncharacterized membrane protein